MKKEEVLSDNELQQCDRVEMLMMGGTGSGHLEISKEEEEEAKDGSGATVPGCFWGSYPASHAAPEQPRNSKYMEKKRRELKLEIAGLEAQLDFMHLLSQMSDDEKMKLLFNVVDTDRSGQISAAELAMALKRRQLAMPWHECLEKAVNSVAIFDRNRDGRLDRTEFEDYVQVLLSELNETFLEFAEFMVLSTTFGREDENHTMAALEQEVMSPEYQQEIDERVNFRREMLEVLVDEKLFELFSLLDKGEKFCLTFRDVANGLYAFTKDMEQSARLTKDLFLLIDQREAEIQYQQAKHKMETSEESKNDGLPSLPAPQGRESINIEEFGRLMIALVAQQQKDEPHQETSFVQLADFFIFTWNNYQQQLDENLSSMANLMIADDALKEYMQQTKANQLNYRTKMNHEDRLRRVFEMWEMRAHLSELNNQKSKRKKSKGRGKIPISSVQHALGLFELACGVSQSSHRKMAKSFLSSSAREQKRVNGKDFVKVVSEYGKIIDVKDMHELIDFLGLSTIFSSVTATKFYTSTYVNQHQQGTEEAERSQDSSATSHQKKSGKLGKKKKHVPLKLPTAPAKMSKLLENEDEEDEESVLEFRV